jgi:hypothetical protein
MHDESYLRHSQGACQVHMTSVSELKELWKEISELASVHLRAKCEAMTQTPKPALNMQDKTVSASVPMDRAVGFTEESACTEMNEQDCSKERQDTDSCYISEQTAYIMRLEEEAVKKEEQVAEIKADLESAYKQIAQLKLHNKELLAADAKLRREDSMNAQKKFFVLEMQLQELGAALKARDDELESIKEERDVLGDEIARLQSRMVKLQRDKIEKYVVVEEASTRNSIEISDLIELIHSEAPWATCRQPACNLTLQETEDDLERLKNIFSILISEIKQTSKQLQSFNTFTLEHGRFDLLGSCFEMSVQFYAVSSKAMGEQRYSELSLIQNGASFEWPQSSLSNISSQHLKVPKWSCGSLSKAPLLALLKATYARFMSFKRV